MPEKTRVATTEPEILETLEKAPPGSPVAVAKLPTSIVLFEPDRFQEALNAEKRKRAMLEDFIRSQLKEGVDYGRIRIHRKACESKWEPEPKCRCPESKPMLFKAGSEKICSVLHLRPTFRRDEDVVSMLGPDGEGVVALVCDLVTEHGDVAGEGRGACGRERTDPNARIKIAEKRAQTDATLRVAGLSDTFGQDLDDVVAEPDPPKAARPAPKPYQPSPEKTPEKPKDTTLRPPWFDEPIGWGKYGDRTWRAMTEGSKGGGRHQYLAWLAKDEWKEKANDKSFADKVQLRALYCLEVIEGGA